MVRNLRETVSSIESSMVNHFSLNTTEDVLLVPNSYLSEEIFSKTKIDSKKTMSLNRVRTKYVLGRWFKSGLF